MSENFANDTQRYLVEAVELARENIPVRGRPFGAVVVKNGEVIARARNEFHLSGDMTDHAELVAIRTAARTHGADSLKGAAVYASGQPCPMCMAAMRLTGVKHVAFAYSSEEGLPFNLSTTGVYEDLCKPFSEQSMDIRHISVNEKPGETLYEQWAKTQQP
jgi:guanine deaminase